MGGSDRDEAFGASAEGLDDRTTDNAIDDDPLVEGEPVLDAQPGDDVGGYRLLRLLGQGGAASVFLAEHPDYGMVAVKVLSAAKTERPRAVERFREESRIAQAVSHASLVDFVELIEPPASPRYAYAMEYVEGLSLRARLAQDSALPLVEAIQIAKQLARGVAALHAAGIIHRDVKPENVMLMPERRPGQGPRVKLLDFGVAKRVGDTRAPSQVEAPGTFVGTPRYMAPEQAAGGDVDERADLFAIGVTLFEMITGQRPHEGDTLKAVVMAKLKGAPRLTVNPDRELLPQELADVVDACLKLQPDLRPASADEVNRSLEEAELVLSTVGSMKLDGSGARVIRAATTSDRLPAVPSLPPQTASLPPPPPERVASVRGSTPPPAAYGAPDGSRWTVPVVASAALVVVAGGAFLWFGSSRESLLITGMNEVRRSPPRPLASPAPLASRPPLTAPATVAAAPIETATVARIPGSSASPVDAPAAVSPSPPASPQALVVATPSASPSPRPIPTASPSPKSSAPAASPSAPPSPKPSALAASPSASPSPRPSAPPASPSASPKPSASPSPKPSAPTPPKGPPPAEDDEVEVEVDLPSR